MVMSTLDFKVSVDPIVCMLCHLHAAELTYGATLADLLAASMTAESFRSTYCDFPWLSIFSLSDTPGKQISMQDQICLIKQSVIH